MIELTNITKTYKISKRKKGLKNILKPKKVEKIKALDNISFRINEGEIVGYIGPNGAGKSTTMKIMCGILTPDEGKCTIAGFNPSKDRKEYVKNIGVVFGNRSALWWDVPVEDSFELIKSIYGLSEEFYQKQKKMLTKMLNIEEIIKIPTRQLSLGQRMRCEIAAAFLHNPKIVFLDEPTIGLDSVSKIAVRQFIKKINKEEGTTIILTTHDTGDIEALTNRVLLIGKGKILLDGKLKSLINEYSKKTITLKIKGKIDELPKGIEIIEKNKDIIKLELDENIISLADSIKYLTGKFNIEDLEIGRTSVDDIVAELYKKYEI